MNASELAPHLALFTFWAFALGCCIGSFMNVVVWRLPRGESLSYPPSHCPKCGHAIRPWENIPIISWLCLRARCSACHLPISIKYPLGEAATGLLFTAVWFSIYKRSLPLAVVLPYFALTAHLLAAALIDAEHRFIPDKVNFSGMAFAFALALIFPSSRLALLPEDAPMPGRLLFTGATQLLAKTGISALPSTAAALLDCILGAAFGFAIIFLFAQAIKMLMPGKEHDAIGWGDIKLMAMIGAFLGADASIYILFAGAILGLLAALLQCAIKRKLKPSIPFAPPLAIAALAWMLFV